jgi:hypothetical protein
MTIETVLFMSSFSIIGWTKRGTILREIIIIGCFSVKTRTKGWIQFLSRFAELAVVKRVGDTGTT